MNELEQTTKSEIRRSLWIVVVAAIVGLLDSALILWLNDLSQNHGLCTSTGLISCKAMMHPTYSKLFGIPWSCFGVLYYAFILLFALKTVLQISTNKLSPNLRALFILSITSLVPTIYLGTVILFEIKSICPYCFVLYLVSFVFFSSTFSAWKKVDHLRDSNRSLKNAIAPWMLFYVAISIAALFGFSRYMSTHKIGTTTHSIASEDLRTLGIAGSAHTLVKFSDFQCPMCKNAAGVIKDLEKEERGNVKIVYKFYPLDSSCNHELKRKMHPDSCNAARAAYCASIQNQFWAYHDMLFENQKELPEKLLIEFAKMLNLDMTAFGQCMQDPSTEAAIQKNLEEGNSLGVQGTPTFYLDGKEYHGDISVEGFRSAMKELSSPQKK